MDACEVDVFKEERELTEEEIQKLKGTEVPDAVEDDETKVRAGYLYCNDLYRVDNKWHYKRDKRYAKTDTRTACGPDKMWVEYNKGDRAYQVGKCKDGRWAYKLSWN